MKPRVWFVMEQQYFRPSEYHWDLTKGKEMSARVATDIAGILEREVDFRLVVLDQSSTLPLPRERVDVVLVKGREDWFLEKIAPLENHPRVLRIVNRPSAVVRYRTSKLLTEAMLRDQGVPTPFTFAALSIDELKMLPETMFPLILKPNRGRWGEGIMIAKSKDGLSGITSLAMPCCAQRFIQNDQRDRKLFVVGRRVFGTIKPSSLVADMDTRNISVQPLAISKKMRQIALSASRVLDLPICGVDLIEDLRGQLYVVDVNDFSSFIGVPNAAETIAQYVLGLRKKRRPAVI